MVARVYVLFYRNKHKEIKAYPAAFFSAEHCLNTGEEQMDKEGWIDYNYRIVDPPELSETRMQATLLQNERIKKHG